MRSATTARFAKAVDCPTAETLLSYKLSGQPIPRSAQIASHLSQCEFCAAEAYFLAKHHNRSRIPETPDMPPHLRLLAEALLKRNVSLPDDLFDVAPG